MRLWGADMETKALEIMLNGLRARGYKILMTNGEDTQEMVDYESFKELSRNGYKFLNMLGGI